MSSSSSFEYKQYFVPGFGISRHIIFGHIQYYLGPSASVRPYSYQGREGYLVTAPGQPLTKSQIEDLQNLSKQYELQAAERMRANESSTEQEELYINRPVPFQQQQRRRYPPDSSRRSR
ncbi:MAG: hypothetical protein FRX48_04849 [Lasallia pustulata]|uniref:Uncharacterized protein n=1 Tax=Lasallia pustulata TaxID=136370 RepID=A0A1W5D1T2_9LECA|nr:MAG: hypothetical protein FRX48_04849 [Lasallia pustulata]SLM37056.1 hypothetical protein LPUS_06782 [Lasallia pustulata]